ncbi:LSD1 zinc finger domain containing protein [Musa troglodytarum]|uniref:LSD1 zinc finger domain containing protein n=1 Tax=Musa troglodytarum TaxID=320322 RepID=A0A9E7KDL6_9LILI|nr:LSD1 zinc finger domain containing protein [Musa troglodytarum]
MKAHHPSLDRVQRRSEISCGINRRAVICIATSIRLHFRFLFWHRQQWEIEESGCLCEVEGFDSFEENNIGTVERMPVPLAPFPTPPPPPPLAPPNGGQGQLVCSGCRNLLLYPQGAKSVCCAVCRAVTTVPPPGNLIFSHITVQLILHSTLNRNGTVDLWRMPHATDVYTRSKQRSVFLLPHGKSGSGSQLVGVGRGQAFDQRWFVLASPRLTFDHAIRVSYSGSVAGSGSMFHSAQCAHRQRAGERRRQARLARVATRLRSRQQSYHRRRRRALFDSMMTWNCVSCLVVLTVL